MISKDKHTLYKFINEKFPGSWEETYDYFSLIAENEFGKIDSNMVLYFRADNYNCYENAVYSKTHGPNPWRYNLSIEELEKFYKMNYKMKNFK